MLGKRKREATVAKRSLQTGSTPAELHQPGAHEVFKHYFETEFEPLSNLASYNPSLEGAEGQQDQSDHESASSEWDGIPDAETAFDMVEVIHHEPLTESENNAIIDSTEVKTFMSTKPPMTSVRVPPATSKSQAQTKVDEGEATNLKNDLDLQRLLQESSLLKKQKEGSRADRHKATDLRLQSLGLKSSLYSQEKMPMAHRQGMKAKAQSREELRRRDARENGIVLEKASKKGIGYQPKRERGVDAPGIGKFRGGTLKLSRRDIADLQGPKQNNSRGGRRK